jgi:hypothetical protein
MSDRYPIGKALIFSATQKDSPDKTVLHHSIFDWHDDVDVIFAVENTQSLSVVYNQAIVHAIEQDYDTLILVHDDVILEHNPIPKLEKLFLKYGLVGVAGCSKAELASPALWHLMGGGFGSGNLHGAVAHGTETEKHMTGFGKYPHQTLMIDGVFMALTKDTFNSVKFDETNPAGFHFYDLDYSYTCAKQKIKVGVGDISITHSSPGLREFTEDWLAGEKWFLNKHT